MTSNLGTPQLHEAMLAQQAALDEGDIESEEVALDSDAVEEIVEPVIQSRLRPELLGARKYNLSLARFNFVTRPSLYKLSTFSSLTVNSINVATIRAIGRDRVFSSSCAGRYSQNSCDGFE